MWQPDEDSGLFRYNKCVIRYLSSGDTSMCACRWLFNLLYIYIDFSNIKKKVNEMGVKFFILVLSFFVYSCFTAVF